MKTRKRIQFFALFTAACVLSLPSWTGLASVVDGTARPAAQPLELIVQPALLGAIPEKRLQAMADYLSYAIGRPVTATMQPNFLAHWESVRQSNRHQLVLDSAHFTDYRVQKLGYEVLVKMPSYLSFTLVILNHDDNEPLTLDELAAKPIATLGAPSIGAVRLSSIFFNPMRQPIIVEVDSAEEGLNMLMENKVAAAFLPADFLLQQKQAHDAVSIIAATEPIPNSALSASPSLDAETRNKIRNALLNAGNSSIGRYMLSELGWARFDPASADLYAGQAVALQQYWGY